MRQKSNTVVYFEQCLADERLPGTPLAANAVCSDCEVNDSITVSSAWELTSVSMRYSQEDKVHTPLSQSVL